MPAHPELKLYNSLTRFIDVFRPLVGNHIKFYICGPTLYDSAHMGHARAYIAFDIVRRVLSSYFNYDVLYVMNVTDIDDKIIKRARQNYLYDQYVMDQKSQQIKNVLQDVEKALIWYQNKFNKEIDVDKKKMMYEMMEHIHKAVKNTEIALKNNFSIDGIDEQRKQLIGQARDVLAEWRDSELGHTVTDLSVFAKLAKHFENDYLEDMRALNVKPPEIITRVSEYIPEIVNFVQRVISNGYAYATQDGSVYFDTEKFSNKHRYAKLMPEAYSDKDSIYKHLREGEGELSIGQEKMSEKKSIADFALWKSSKAGEPFWDSPWGRGRPGWHVECSVMSTAICGETLDVHAGGFDLKFPHHDNEIAQCEAYFDYDDWVKYFLHCGTLRIEGLKMSKSLKNFITIKDALKKYTAVQLRFLFLMHSWPDCLDFSAAAMERALQFEKFSNEFFLNIKDLIRRQKVEQVGDLYQKFSDAELELLKKFLSTKNDIHAALCDSIDTRTVVEKLREIINNSNIYIREKQVLKQTPNARLLKTISDYISSLLRIFGVLTHEEQQSDYDVIDSQKNAVTNRNREDEIMPYLELLAEFRQTMRTIGRETKNNQILEECDRLRNEVLPPMGVRLEDSLEHTAVKLVDPEVLIREQEQKRQLDEAKRLEKERKEQEKKEKELKKRVPPQELFKQGPYIGKFSQFDADGLPTHDAQGEEIGKGQRKKLQKLWNDQKKLHAVVVGETQ